MMYTIRFVILLSLLAACHQKKETRIDKEKIIGVWRLIGANGSKSKFTRNERLDYVESNLMASYTYSIDDDDILTDIDKSNGEIYKWRIKKLTTDSLVVEFVRLDYEQKFVRMPSDTLN